MALGGGWCEGPLSGEGAYEECSGSMYGETCKYLGLAGGSIDGAEGSCPVR